MRVIVSLLVALTAHAQTISDYAYGDWIVLGSGSNQVTLNDGAVKTILGVPPISSVPGSDRVAIRIYLQFDGGGSDAACASPCSITLPRRAGNARYQWQYRNGGSVVHTSSTHVLYAATRRQSGTITMPLELVGFAGKVEEVSFTPAGSTSGPLRLYLQAHSLTYDGKVAVRVNGGNWTNIAESTVTRLDWCGELGGYGGFGGQCQTHEFTMALADGVVTSGVNTIGFRFNSSFWNSSGARVLKANILRPAQSVSQVVVSSSGTVATIASASHGLAVGNSVLIRGVRRGGFRVNGLRTVVSVPNANTFTVAPSTGVFDGTYTNANMTVSRALIPLSTFVEENPATWTGPSSDPGEIAAGEALWRAESSLLDPERFDLTSGPITASCSNCHSEDGRDLQYFNFSNESIIARSIYHGLTRKEGEQIASFIRSLNVPRPARPWSPLYQPGPGLDSAPLENWSAGAGLDWVLGEDIDMVPYLSEPTQYAHNAHLNTREIPWNLQFLDWNAWLPKVHPKDALPATWASNNCRLGYEELASTLQYRNATIYGNAVETWSLWKDHCLNSMRNSLKPSGEDIASREDGTRTYSIGLWAAGKHWEFMQKFALEDMGNAPFPRNIEARSWSHNVVFMVSPNQSHLDRSTSIATAGKQPNTHVQLSNYWYNLQLILNCCSGGQASGVNPVDWGYAYGFHREAQNVEGDGGVTLETLGGPSQWGNSLLYLAKSLQAFERNTNNTPSSSDEGWEPNTSVRPSSIVSYEIVNGTYISQYWTAAERTLLLTNFLQAYYNKVSTFTPSQFYAGGWASSGQTPQGVGCNAGGDGHPQMICKVFWMLPRYKHLGVSSTLINQLVDYFKQIWTSHGTVWDRIKTSTCTDGGFVGIFNCTSDNQTP